MPLSLSLTRGLAEWTLRPERRLPNLGAATMIRKTMFPGREVGWWYVPRPPLKRGGVGTSPPPLRRWRGGGGGGNPPQAESAHAALRGTIREKQAERPSINTTASCKTRRPNTIQTRRTSRHRNKQTPGNLPRCQVSSSASKTISSLGFTSFGVHRTLLTFICRFALSAEPCRRLHRDCSTNLQILLQPVSQSLVVMQEHLDVAAQAGKFFEPQCWRHTAAMCLRRVTLSVRVCRLAAR